MTSVQQEWTARKRVLEAIDHRQPDRVPISFGGTSATGILGCPPTGRTYSALCKHLGILDYEEPNVSPVFNMVGNIDERVRKRFGSDLRMINGNPPEVRIGPDGTKTILGIYCGLRVKKMGYYDDVFEFPLKDLSTRKEIKEYPFWPVEEDFNLLSKGREKKPKRCGKILIAQ